MARLGRGLLSRGRFKGALSGSRGGGRNWLKFGSNLSRRAARSAVPTFKMTFDQQKSYFLDRPRWRGLIDSGERDALMFAGGYVRKAAKRSMRKRSGYSQPGQTPTVWEGTLKNMISFHIDPNTGNRDQNSVIVGPGYLEEIATKQGVLYLQRQTIPRTLELGGHEIKQDAGHHEFLGPDRTRVTYMEPAPRSFYIAKRPYMNPAMKRSAPYIMRYFRNMLVKGGVGFRRVA